MSEVSQSPSGGGRFITNALEELGLLAMWQSSRDVKLLCAQRFVRLFAYGGSTLVLASYLSAIGIADDKIGLFMTLTLVGDVAISFLLTLFADSMGRKAVLALGSIMMACSGIVFALFGNYWILLAAAVFGVISPRYVFTPHFQLSSQIINLYLVAMKLALSVLWKNLLSRILRRKRTSVTSSHGIPWSARLVQLSDSLCVVGRSALSSHYMVGHSFHRAALYSSSTRVLARSN
jgi:MFS family permease